MAGLELLSERLRRLGALPPDDVFRVLPLVCDRLALLGPSTVRLDSVGLSATDDAVDITALPVDVPPEDLPRAQVKAVAAMAFELLKGMPPPEVPGPGDFIGLRPQVVRVLQPALVGLGASTLALFAAQLRTLQSGNTLGYAQAHDTVPKRGAVQPSDTERAGEIIGSYELVKRLGAGGMGEVFVARHLRLGREVAIKLLRPEYADQPDIVERFFQEARVVNDINHPNIVQISDFAQAPGHVYCVMELLHGRSLAQLALEEGPLRVARICTLVAQACRALEAAHARGVVHRDIKPDNLFVTPSPSGAEVVKVLDFGIARRLRPAESAHTQHGMVLGTPYYMAPEQAAGRAVDAKADLYAVGVVLFELLSGQSLAIVGTPPRLHRAASGEAIPVSLADLVASCLQLDPSLRPSSAAEVQRALERLPSKRAAQWAAPAAAAVMLGGLVLGWRASMTGPDATPPPPAPAAAAPEKMTVREEPPMPPPPPAGTPPPAAKSPPTAKPRPARPPEAPAVMKGGERGDALRQRYTALVQRHGAAQLTLLEHAAVEQALTTTATAEDLDVADQALRQAETRLNR